MKTDPLTPAELVRSVWAVPPVALADEAPTLALVRHLEAGGVSTILWGGDADLCDMDAAACARLLDAIPGWVAPGTWALPSVGPDGGRLREEVTA